MKKLMMTVAALGGVTLFAGNALAASDYDCRVYAEQQANAYAPNGAGAVTGGLLGALGGAAIAGISGGNTGTGAIAGGVGGAVIGGVGNQQNRQQIYNNAYWQCRGKATTPRLSRCTTRAPRLPATASSGGCRLVRRSTIRSSGPARTPASSRATTAIGTGAASRPHRLTVQSIGTPATLVAGVLLLASWATLAP